VPDATGLELIARELRDADADAVLDTIHYKQRATVILDPEKAHAAIEQLKTKSGFGFLASLHGVDHYPEEPRLGVVYELLDMDTVDRISVKIRVPTDAPEVDSVVDLWAGADHQEREVFDMFGVVFRNHPNLRRILMPEDYEGFPQRRDFPIGGEPVIFTYNEHSTPGWTD
jgi:NADH-quinone oxidoreductase subunit C